MWRCWLAYEINLFISSSSSSSSPLLLLLFVISMNPFLLTSACFMARLAFHHANHACRLRSARCKSSRVSRPSRSESNCLSQALNSPALISFCASTYPCANAIHYYYYSDRSTIPPDDEGISSSYVIVTGQF